MVELFVKAHGRLDAMVCNAGIAAGLLLVRHRDDEWTRIIDTNLTGTFHCMQAAAARMIETGGGSLIVIGSYAGAHGTTGQAAYASAKAGLVALTRVVAMDMARSKVACNAIAPFAATRVTESIQPDNEAQAAYKARALRIPAHYVARVAAFLASNAHEVSGQLFGVRGRELMLFSQPRPVARLTMEPGTAWDPDGLGKSVSGASSGAMTDLATDLEFFNSEPQL